MMTKVRIRYSELVTSLGFQNTIGYFLLLLILHFFLADVNELLLFNDSPRIVGKSLTLDYRISGCAQVLCEVKDRTAKFDCEYTYMYIIHALLMFVFVIAVEKVLLYSRVWLVLLTVKAVVSLYRTKFLFS